MRKRITLKGIFDPLTESEVKVIRQYVRKGYAVAVYAEGEGVLSVCKRMQLLTLALRPYRHIHIVFSKKGLDITDGSEEEKVRCGFYYRAARGICRMLVEEGMYFAYALQVHCSSHRCAHSISVAALCMELAARQGVNMHAAWTAGMLHDITKSMPKEQAYAILQHQNPDQLHVHPNIWHAYTACYWLKRNMGMRDRKILRAIGAHTTGEAKAKLAMILYVADKCERTRGYNTEVEIALAKKDLRKAFELVKQEAQAYRRREENG